MIGSKSMNEGTRDRPCVEQFHKLSSIWKYGSRLSGTAKLRSTALGNRCVVGFGRHGDTEIQTRGLEDPTHMESDKKLEFHCLHRSAKCTFTHEHSRPPDTGFRNEFKDSLDEVRAGNSV